jgi:uncharacterized protein (DUF1501 family)
MSNWSFDVTRRLFLRSALAGAGIALLGPFGRQWMSDAWATDLTSRSKSLKRLTIIYLYGGNDGLNTVVPITLAPYEARRGPLALDKKTLHSLDTGPHASKAYALHPSLSNLAAIWVEGNLAVVNKMGYPNSNMSHFVSQDIWSFGIRGEFAPLHIPPSGWIARYADRFTTTPTGAVAVGEKMPKDILGGSMNRFHAVSLESFSLSPRFPVRHAEAVPQYAIPLNDPRRIERIIEVMHAVDRSGLKQDVGHAMDSATDMLDTVRTALAGYKSSVKYPNTVPATCLRDIATMCNAGFDTRIFFTGYSDFDHHSNQPNSHADLLLRLDQGLGAFVQDLKSMGMWDDMVVAVVSEFGRRNYANGSAGTDHGHGNLAFVMGGNIKGGIYGSELTAADLEAESLPVEIDFRSIYRELLEKHLEADPATVFPEHQDMNTKLGLFEA